MKIQIGRRAEALNEGDRAGVSLGSFPSGLFDQKGRDNAVNDLKDFGDALRMGGQQGA
jgi:hypothetical protein